MEHNTDLISSERKQYQSPELTHYGTIQDLTASGTSGAYVDPTFGQKVKPSDPY